jgi:hypothetical protein
MEIKMPKSNNPRRQFLQGCSYAIASMAGARLTNLSFAQEDNSSDTLVVVFLRGGWGRAERRPAAARR